MEILAETEVRKTKKCRSEWWGNLKFVLRVEKGRKEKGKKPCLFKE